MTVRPNYQEAHLVVAGVRVLLFKEGRPPTPEEVAALLGMSVEKVHVLVHELSEMRVLRALRGPFTTHLDVIDPRPLEQLPRGDDEPAIKQELADFGEKSREKKIEMDRMFRGGEAERRRKERVSRLEEQFKTFKPKRGEFESLFGQGDAGDEEA
jgi:hypothetical protein